MSTGIVAGAALGFCAGALAVYFNALPQVAVGTLVGAGIVALVRWVMR